MLTYHNKNFTNIPFFPSLYSNLKFLIWSFTLFILTACTGPINQANISLSQPAEFTTAEGVTVNVPAGDYQISPADGNAIILTPASGATSLQLSATSKEHTEELDAALGVSKEDEKGHKHLILMLPNGVLLDATESTGHTQNNDITERNLSLRPMSLKKRRQRIIFNSSILVN